MAAWVRHLIGTGDEDGRWGDCDTLVLLSSAPPSLFSPRRQTDTSEIVARELVLLLRHLMADMLSLPHTLPSAVFHSCLRTGRLPALPDLKARKISHEFGGQGCTKVTCHPLKTETERAEGVVSSQLTSLPAHFRERERPPNPLQYTTQLLFSFIRDWAGVACF